MELTITEKARIALAKGAVKTKKHQFPKPWEARLLQHNSLFCTQSVSAEIGKEFKEFYRLISNEGKTYLKEYVIPVSSSPRSSILVKDVEGLGDWAFAMQEHIADLHRAGILNDEEKADLYEAVSAFFMLYTTK